MLQSLEKELHFNTQQPLSNKTYRFATVNILLE